jgi:hypothetical protein
VLVVVNDHNDEGISCLTKQYYCHVFKFSRRLHLVLDWVEKEEMTKKGSGYMEFNGEVPLSSLDEILI